MRILGRTLVALMLLSSKAAVCQAEDARPAAGIQDNSFLIEEAYNQEKGVIQHINAWRRLNGDWLYTFTEEWPVGSQTHQLSFTLPYTWLKDGENGLGDLQLNYRYQLSMETANRPAIAPRATLIVPTGDEDKGLGEGSTGFQFSLPISKIVSDRVSVHGNAGLTTYADVDGFSPTSFNVGASAIYAVTRDFNWMLEAAQEWNEDVVDGAIDHENAFTISPGFRTAINIEGGTQIVMGAAAPIRFSDAPVDYGVYLYFSVEHHVSALGH